MKAKKYYRQKNYMTWFEFWRPKQAAALAAEAEQNRLLAQANSQQDILEANMSSNLTAQDNALAAKKFETYKTIGLVVVCAIIIYVIVKYV